MDEIICAFPSNPDHLSLIICSLIVETVVFFNDHDVSVCNDCNDGNKDRNEEDDELWRFSENRIFFLFWWRDMMIVSTIHISSDLFLCLQFD